jgi:nitrogen fixation protein FixH
MTTRAARSGEFTGKHMLALMVAFFGVVIAVNLLLATLAGTSWTGLVVENEYVASQEFNERAAKGRAQAALGWSGALAIDRQGISYRLLDRGGQPVAMDAVTVKLRRPAYAGEDQALTLARAADGAFVLSQPVRDGVWIVEVDTALPGRAPYRDVRRVVVSGGTLQ